MKKEEYLNLQIWFQDHVRSFHSEDTLILQNIKLKEEHTTRVCENSSRIAISEKLDDDNYYLAITIALLHDIGRFEQISRYKTFHDSISEDHALLGVKVLRSEGVLSFLSQEKQNIVFTAIKNHNMPRVPDGFDGKTLLHSKLVRDADKLDIYKVLTDYYLIKDISPNPVLEHGLPDDEEYSPYLIQDIFNNKIPSIKEVRTCNDMNLARLAWLFDLNFIETFRLVKEKGYIEKLIATLPQNSEINAVHVHLKKYLDCMLWKT
ncbi:MAG: HD domain-containing protein [Methanomethylovorans sp.]|nr:HD domain-containing protein [Methanomethylovorans sp.]